jgi:hypothetical protein
MNILDENIIASQRQRLRSWRIPVRQIGVDIARKGLQDEEILPFLHHLHRPTFFTRDRVFIGVRSATGSIVLSALR